MKWKWLIQFGGQCVRGPGFGVGERSGEVVGAESGLEGGCSNGLASAEQRGLFPQIGGLGCKSPRFPGQLSHRKSQLSFAFIKLESITAVVRCPSRQAVSSIW